MVKIPIKNIYYLLSYAWNKLNESELVEIERIECDTLMDLFAQVLANGIKHLLKQGLDRSYVPYTKTLETIRGKIDFTATLKYTYLMQPAVYCEFDELDHDILHNQIIKTTLGRLIRGDQIDKTIQADLLLMYKRLWQINEIPLRKRHFGLVQLHSNNSFYDLLLKICELIHDCYFVDERDGTAKFRDFLRDENKMALLFEEFVRNFYKIEQKQFKVSRKDINWDVTADDEESLSYLPKMQTDIFLDSPERKIIIDTKYYSETLNTYYDKQKIHSTNLYQLHAYLRNIEAWGEDYKNCEGILLYPVVVNEEDILFKIKSHEVRIKTINLNQEWQKIAQDLDNLIILN